MKKYIEQNPFLSVIVAAGVAVGAMMSISTGFERLDRIVKNRIISLCLEHIKSNDCQEVSYADL